MFHSRFCSLLLVLGLCLPAPATAAVYYVRTDGGTAAQCTGLADAAYPGSGQTQDCAWAHPFWALTSGDPPTWRIQGGDTLLIGPGEYLIGLGAPNSGWCDQGWPYACVLPPLPSGASATQHTVLAGSTWQSGCSQKPQLFGVERADQVIQLDHSSHVTLACLEITDHESCVQHHAFEAARCNRDTYPYGDWASVGIFAADSDDLLFQDLDIHGLADYALLSGRLSDVAMRRVRMAGNGWGGWSGDLGSGSSSNSGAITLQHVTVEWNGCAETWPGLQPADCWGQASGGYGDGVGMASTGGQWLIEDSVFQYNTSDGLDLLYVGRDGATDATITIRRVMARSNAGNPLKTANTAHIENAVAVADCSFFEGKPFAPDIYGQPSMTHCRAGGNALSLDVRQGQNISVINTTIAGEGDCLIISECADTSCDGSETFTLQNLIMLGGPQYGDADQVCALWTGMAFDIQNDYNVVHDTKPGSYTPGSNDITGDPLLRNDSLQSFDGRLQKTSPARDTGLPVGGLIPATDYLGVARPQGPGVDRGAYELRTGVATTPLTPLLLEGE